jgi:hypothetical protein
MTAPPLHLAAASGLFGFLGRREINAVIQVVPALVALDPHPGRLIHACNRRNVPRLRLLLESGRAPYGWPRRRYKVHGSTHEAATLFEAAKNAYCQEAALVAVSYMDKWTHKTAALYIWNLVGTSWTGVADALLAKGGPKTMEHLWEHTNYVLCHGSAEMIRWYAAHGADLNVRCPLYGQTALQHHVHFTNKEKVALLLSLGAIPDAATVAECFDRYSYYRHEDPEGSGDWDAMEILRMLIPYAPSAMRSLYRGMTPAMQLVSEVWGRGDLLALMLKHGADPAQKDAQGRTALWWAENTCAYGVPCQEYVAALR